METLSSFSHKTIVVLDHGPSFAQLSGEAIEVALKDARTSKQAMRLDKSLWTCAVEAALEYQRVVADLFPDGSRQLRFVVSDFVGRFLTAAWSPKLQAVEVLMKALSTNGAPNPESDPDSCCIINGVSLAVEALSEVTEQQKIDSKNGTTIVNRGRIVVITRLKQDEEVSMIEQHVLEQIESRNKLVQNLDENYLPLAEIELCIINTHPFATEISSETTIVDKPCSQIAEGLLSEVRCAPAGQKLVACVHGLLLQHYNLVSTTVSGIPMKEEANQGQSVNYDVELFHRRDGHSELDRLGLMVESAALATSVASGAYRTLRLAWCTPSAKNPIDQFPQVASVYRVTPASVNSRPSACLTTFLLSGKNVMLEVARKPGTAAAAVSPNVSGRLISHLLMCHDGIIYVHSMALGKGIFEDPPSISEGPGGRVTDYRISSFGDLMKECWLAPGELADSQPLANNSARRHLRRITRHWPLTFGETLVFSVAQKFEPLVTLVRKTTLTAADVDACLQHIYNLINMEQSREPLLAPAMQCAKVKGIKSREEQYRVAFEELADYLRNYANHSDNHLKVFNCLLSCAGLDKTSMPISDVDLSSLPPTT
uniref:Protein asunder n=1 Tax=Plectus sambesii TaxID=2011161 RepID=A0A914WNF2_9BILA